MNDEYEEIRRDFIDFLTNDDMLFTSIDEALECYEEVENDKDTADRLADDIKVQRAFRRHMIQEKAKLRRSMIKGGKAGNDKMAKAVMSLMADDDEWARLNGKSFKQLSVGENNRLAPIQIINPDVKKLPTKVLLQLLADRQAKDGDTEEEEI